jgi:hypothetical protein
MTIPPKFFIKLVSVGHGCVIFLMVIPAIKNTGHWDLQQ